MALKNTKDFYYIDKRTRIRFRVDGYSLERRGGLFPFYYWDYVCQLRFPNAITIDQIIHSLFREEELKNSKRPIWQH